MKRKAKAPDRRVAVRRTAEGLVAFGWWEGEEFRTTEANLLDISLSGTRLSSQEAPTAGTRAWLLFRSSGLEEWIEGMVVGVERVWRRPSVVRVQFVEPCPYDCFRAAVQGCLLEGGEPPPEREDLGDHLWR